MSLAAKAVHAAQCSCCRWSMYETVHDQSAAAFVVFKASAKRAELDACTAIARGLKAERASWKRQEATSPDADSCRAIDTGSPGFHRPASEAHDAAGANYGGD